MNEINKQLQNVVPKKQDLVNDNIITFDKEVFNNLDQETIKYLEASAFDILNISAKSQLQLGRKFQEIFDTLGNQGVEDGVYTKYITFLGYNDRTVLRYRNRWKLYNLIENNIRLEEDFLMFKKYWPEPIAKIFMKLYKKAIKTNKM